MANKRGNYTVKTQKPTDPSNLEGYELLETLNDAVYDCNRMVPEFRVLEAPVTVRVMQFDNQVATDKVTMFHPTSIKVVNFDMFVKYQGSWYPLTAVKANSCNMITEYAAIVLGQKLDKKPS